MAVRGRERLWTEDCHPEFICVYVTKTGSAFCIIIQLTEDKKMDIMTLIKRFIYLNYIGL